MIRVFPDLEALSRAAADYIALVGRSAVADRGAFSLVLAGGNTPRRAYEILAAISRDDRALWDAAHVYWGDERCVPPDSPASNYRMAKIALLDPLGLRPGQVHRIPAEEPDRQAAADRYAAAFPAQPDLIVLGVGDDGHTASLFPGHGVLDETAVGFALSEAPVAPRERITITAPAIAAALDVLVLASGTGKVEALKRVFNKTGSIHQTPARLVRDRVWFVDCDAAQGMVEFRADDPQRIAAHGVP